MHSACQNRAGRFVVHAAPGECTVGPRPPLSNQPALSDYTIERGAVRCLSLSLCALSDPITWSLTPFSLKCSLYCRCFVQISLFFFFLKSKSEPKAALIHLTLVSALDGLKVHYAVLGERHFNQKEKD